MPVSMYGTRGHQRLPAMRGEQREHADGEDGRIGLADMGDEIAQSREEARFLRHRDAEEVAQLRADDQQAGAGGEADDDRRRDEVDERAEPGNPEPELDQADHQVQRQHERHVGRRERRGKAR